MLESPLPVGEDLGEGKQQILESLNNEKSINEISQRIKKRSDRC